jgi:hypothetical protein
MVVYAMDRISMIILIAFVSLLFFGCVQMAQQAGGDLQTCMNKCGDLCSLAKSNNMSLEGFNSIGLSKQTGAVSVKCNCPCS